jgi:hypothetical protein
MPDNAVAAAAERSPGYEQSFGFPAGILHKRLLVRVDSRKTGSSLPLHVQKPTDYLIFCLVLCKDSSNQTSDIAILENESAPRRHSRAEATTEDIHRKVRQGRKAKPKD